MRNRTRHRLTASILATLSLGAFWLAHAGEPVAVEPKAAQPVAAEKTCVECHGKSGVNPEPGLPIIGGQSADYLADALADYRGEARPCPEEEQTGGDPTKKKTDEKTSMCRIAKSLSEQEIAKLSEELASVPFARAKKCTNPEKVAAGRKLHELYCSRCHDAKSADDSSAMLEGQNAEYLEDALKKIEDGERNIPKKMRKKLAELSPEHRKALLEYYASFK
jgi:sulfide dehydrogenase cytochrome subunit